MPDVHVVVGGVGFVGANLVEELVGRGLRVVVASRRSSLERRPLVARFLRGLGVEFAVAASLWDVDFEGLGGGVYYYLPGALTGGLKAMREAHVDLLARVLDAANNVGARLVHVSSIAALGVMRGWRRGCIIVEEERHLEGERLYPSMHMETKAWGERLVVERGARWSIVRPGVVFGPWGYHMEWRLLLASSRIRLGPRLGRGMPHIYSQDLARILADAGEGAYDSMWINAVDPLHPDIGDIFQEICRRVGRRCVTAPVWPLIAFAGRVAGRGSPLRLFYSILAHGCHYSSRHLSGFEWTPLDSQVEGFIGWVREWLS